MLFMDVGSIVNFLIASLTSILSISAWIVLPAFLVSILVSMFQAMTSIQEQTLTFIPKLIMVVGSIIIFGPMILNKMVTMFNSVLSIISGM